MYVMYNVHVHVYSCKIYKKHACHAHKIVRSCYPSLCTCTYSFIFSPFIYLSFKHTYTKYMYVLPLHYISSTSLPLSLPPVGKNLDYVFSRIDALNQYLNALGGKPCVQNPGMPRLCEAWGKLVPDHIRHREPNPGTPLLVYRLCVHVHVHVHVASGNVTCLYSVAYTCTCMYILVLVLYACTCTCTCMYMYMYMHVHNKPTVYFNCSFFSQTLNQSSLQGMTTLPSLPSFPPQDPLTLINPGSLSGVVTASLSSQNKIHLENMAEKKVCSIGSSVYYSTEYVPHGSSLVGTSAYRPFNAILVALIFQVTITAK